METIINREICELLDEREMEYSAYVILHRALPDMRDGFKPSYRRILYSMQKEGMTKLTKSADVEGVVMRLHPHGGCYPTIVNMVQKDTNLNPLIDGKGSFAQHTSRDMQPASPRYTEVKLSDYGANMMKGLNKNIVDMIPSYDGAKIEPVVLPVRHPQILTLAQQGMAVGMASNFPSFNLKEVCEATIKYIETGEKTILIPDFATKGYVIRDDKAFEEINMTGKGTIKLRGKYEISGQNIIITEIPYTTTREEIIEKIEQLVKEGKLKDVIDIVDITGLNTMGISIKAKKGTDMELLAKKLYQITTMETTYSANMNVLYNDTPTVMGVWDIIPEWCKWRNNCIKRVIEFDTDELRVKLHFLKGLEKCLIDIDKVISIIRHSKEDEIISKLMKEFDIDELQAEDIASMKLRDINKDKIINRVAEIKSIEDKIAWYEYVCSSEEELSKRAIDGLKDVIAKFGKERSTQIIEVTDEKPLSKEIMVEEYNCYITLTEKGYLKKTKLASDNHKMKDGDRVLQQLSCTNKMNILLFSDKGNLYTIKNYENDLVAPSAMGSYLPTILKMDKDENIIYIVPTLDYKGDMLFGFENGKVAKVSLESYNTTRSKLLNAYNMDSKLVHISLAEDKLMVAKSSIDKVLIFSNNTINSKNSRTSQGVAVLKSKNDSYMKSLEYLPDGVEQDVVDYYLGKTNAVGNFLKKEHNDMF